MSAAKADLARANPKREARREAMLQAALELFLERGYAGISLNDVVKRSGGSLATLYELFGGKLGLLRACVESCCDQLTEGMQAPAEVVGASPREALLAFGRRLFGLVTSPIGLGGHRVLIAEHAQVAELAPTFYATGPDASKDRVASYLAELAGRGVLAIDTPRRAAEHLCHLIVGDSVLRMLAGMPVDTSPEAVDAHVADVVDLFLRAYAPRSPEAT